MTAPAFVAGQMVRISSPGLVGDQKIGMITAQIDYGMHKHFEVTFPVSDAATMTQEYRANQLRDPMEPGSVTLDYSDIPDPRIAIAQALIASFAPLVTDPALTYEHRRERAQIIAELAAIGATELLEQLSKGK